MAQLRSIPILRPGGLGINSQDDGDVLPQSWATVSKNTVFNDSGKLASRPGSKRLHSNSIAGDVESMIYYTDGTGASIYVVGSGDKLWKVTGGTATDISGSYTPTNGNWQFQEFNGKLVAFQEGEGGIVIDDVTDTFDEIVESAGTMPTGNVCLAAFGRVWGVTNDTLYWSDLLDETAWAGGSSGNQPLSDVWPGYDQVVGLAEHNGFLIVFGSKSIIIFESPDVPADLARVESIKGSGLAGRDCIVSTPSDLVYLSSHGPVQLGRTVQEKSAPVSVLAPQMSNDIRSGISSTSASDLSMAYQQKGVVYIRTEDGTFVIDLRREGAPVTLWDSNPKIYGHADKLLIGTTNYLENSEGWLDNVDSDDTDGVTYTMTLETGWMDLSIEGTNLSSQLKFIKRIVPYTIGGSGYVVTIGWALDSDDTFLTSNYTIPVSNVWEFGSSVYDTAVWSLDKSVLRKNIGASRAPRILKLKFQTTVNGNEIALLRLDIFGKVGRQI